MPLTLPHTFTDGVRQTASGAQVTADFAAVKSFVDGLETSIASLLATVNALVTPGMLLEYVGTAAPSGWVLCDGTAVTAGISAPLRTLLLAAGSPFGVSGSDPRLPDLRGRAPLGAGAGSGLTARTLGQLIGAETHRLVEAELPRHNHDVLLSTPGVASGGLSGGLVGLGSNYTGMSDSGGDVAHNNMAPVVVVNFICKL